MSTVSTTGRDATAAAARLTGERRRRPGRRRSRRSFASLLVGLLMIAPTFAFVGYFMYYPVYVAMAGSFTDWDGFNAANFVGLDNYARAFSDPELGRAAINNVVWAVGKVFLAIIPPFIVAELIFHLRGRRFQYLYRTLFVLPLMVPALVTILVWSFYYRSDGLVNQLFGAIGLDSLVHGWLTDRDTALGALIFMEFPWVTPFNLLILYAGLQSIPKDILEAAELDGCAGLSRIRRIHVPMLVSSTNLLITLAVIGSAQSILEPLIMTGGGPGNTTLTPILYMYRSATQYGDFGYSMAVALMVFAVVLLLSVISRRLLTRV